MLKSARTLARSLSSGADSVLTSTRRMPAFSASCSEFALRGYLLVIVMTLAEPEAEGFRRGSASTAAARGGYFRAVTGGPRRARTDDPRIKSPLLCQLS